MTSVVLQAALIIGTAFWWGPLMARLEGPDRSLLHERYELLMMTRWGRVTIISAHALLMLWMLTLALE
jgi:hypothetical protein